MSRTRIVGGTIVVVAAAALLAMWRGDRAQSARPRSHATESQGPAPLAIATGRHGEIASTDPAGVLRLEGQVIDAGDQPVGGARVTIDMLPARTITTEADGSFAFEELLPRRYQITAAAGDGVAGPATIWVTPKSAAIVLKLRPAAGVDVTVVNAETGAPIANAIVEVRAPAVAPARTGAMGVAAITPVVPGNWPVVVKARDFATAFANVSASATAHARLAVALKRGLHVRGRIVDQADKAVPDANVWLDNIADWVTDEADPSRDGARSGPDGSFDLEGVANASYVVRAVAPDRSSAASGVLHVDRDTDGIVLRVVHGPRVSGRAVHKDGTAASGATVRATWMHGSALTHVDRDARFVLDGLPRATVWLSASDQAASSRPIRLDLGSASPPEDLMLTLENEGAISGIVVDRRGAPVEGAIVSGVRTDALEAGANAASNVQELSDAGGRFTLRGLVAGNYALSATREPRRDDSDSRTMAKTGATDVVLTLKSTGRIKGRVALKTGGKPSSYTVRLGRGGLGAMFTSDEFEIEAPPGLRSLWIDGPGFTATSVDGLDVREAAVTDAGTITLDPGRTLRGRVISADGSPLVAPEVIAGALLSGTGQRVDTGDGGPAFRSDVKRATAGPDGSFELAGVTTGAVSVVASVASGARSSPVLVPAGSDEVSGLALAITRDARLTGTVTSHGQPATALVNAQAQASPLTMFTVEAAGGLYHFDQLAPGRYTVAAILGDPLTGSPFFPRTVDLTPGVAAKVDLPADPGSASLAVHAPGSGTGLVFVTTRGGTASSALALLVELGHQDGGQWAMAPISGDTARFKDLEPGPARVCLVRIPLKGIVSASALIEQIARGGAAIAASCITTNLAGATSVTIDR